ncbi:hypothetical protein MAXJ12_03837, partial [Mesorhizobium alhagi CCNWXJ12-2]
TFDLTLSPEFIEGSKGPRNSQGGNAAWQRRNLCQERVTGSRRDHSTAICIRQGVAYI